MRDRTSHQDDAVRVGLWMLIAAAGAGLLVLLLHSRAEAACVSVEDAAEWLSERQPLAAGERVEAAEAELQRSSRRRLREVNAGTLETGARILTGASPYGVAKSSYRLARRLFRLRVRSPGEDAALEWLEPALHTPTETDLLRERYQELRERERRALARRKIERAERAFERGYPLLARLRAERSLELWPGLGAARRLLEELPDPAASDSSALAADDAITASPEEARVAAALLHGNGADARALVPDTRSGALTRGVLDYLDGDREQALDRFARLSEGEDAPAELARRWIQDPEVDVAESLRRERRTYRTRRTLGWVGGAALAADGLDVSSDAYQAWRRSLRPLNLALSLPARVIGGFKPEQSHGLRAAANTYLESLPDGPLAGEAEGWLEHLGPDPSLTLFSDGNLVLPAAATPYATLLAEPVVISRRVLEYGLFERGELLAHAFGDARAIVLIPRQGAQDASALRGDDALAVIAELSRGLERGELTARERSAFGALEALRRLETAVRDGAALRARAYAPDGPELGLRRTLLDGGSARAVGGVDVARDGDELQLAKRFVSEPVPCPERGVCIDREPAVDAAVFGKVEADSDARLGFQGRVFDTRVSLEVSTDRAEAEIVLPVTQWLGVDGWLPFDARFGVGTEGISVYPRLRAQDEDEARSWELGIRKEF